MKDDVLKVVISWPNITGNDLDIYLYKSGNDFLSTSSFLFREFSATKNPETLTFTTITSMLYYVRVDLYSYIPTPYKIQISVNGKLVLTDYNTVIIVSSGLTAQQFVINSTCTAKILYDGPIYDIFLYKPGSNIQNDPPVASNTTLVNPK